MKMFPLAVGACLLGNVITAVPGRGQTVHAPSVSPTPAPVAALPPVVGRYEQMLTTTPAKGTAFDKVYQFFFEGEGLDALAARWHARAGDGADTFLLLEGLLAERRARPDDARERYAAYTQRHPEDPRGWTALGELETAEGRFGASADALTHALAPDAKPPVPAATRPTLYRELARAQTREFLVAAALATWRKLAAEFPDDPTVLQEVGEALQEGQAYDDARFTFAKLRDLAGHNGDAFGRINATLHLGQVEEARGNAPEAVKVYEGVVADAKAGSWLEREARARIEQLYRSQEDLPGLSEYYKKWLADHPRDLEVATRRAAVLVELNRRDEAIDLLKQATSWAPDRQELQVELARRLTEADRPAEAAAVMEKLTAAAPEEKSYWVMLGDARWQLLAANPPGASAADKAEWRQGALDAWAHLALPDSRDGVEAGNLADLLASHHLPDETLAQYARGAALAPELIDLRERWASYLTGLDRRDEAKAVLAGIVTASPKNATAANYSRLANALDRLDDTDGALDATAKGLALEPHNFDVLAQRWDLLAARKRWDDALALYPALLAAAPGVYYAEQVQTRHIAALAAAGKLPEARQELAARLGGSKTPPLDEAEMCLLVRIDLQSGDTGGDHPDETAAALDEARRTLAQGTQRFLRSVALVRAGIELTRRAHDPVAQVAALRRLAELQPAQKTDALEQIVRVWRDSNHPDDAVAAARELVAASPASAPAHLLLADLLLANGRSDEGIGYLREAVRLSDRPNDVRQHLAGVQADLGRNTDARKTLDEAFEAAADSHERLSMTKGLAEAYQREGKLDELIARFQRLQQAEADGWRYALYLAEIYETTQDTAGARRELAKALSARPKDASLLRQLVRLATNEENAAEFARYQRQLAEVEPSDVNQLALVKALLANDEADAALDALAAHLSAIVKIPGAWDELLPLLTQKALTGKAGDLLARELGGEKADARNRFTLALFQMTAGHLDEAKAALWGIFALRSPLMAATAIKPPAPPVAPPDEAYLVFYGDGGTLAEGRLADAARARAFAQTLLDPESAQNGQSLGLANASGSTVALAGHPDPLDTTRDTALIYLAAIAVKQNATAPFLAELDRQLAARDSSREDRLIAYASVDATDGLLREIAAQARTPEGDLDIFCSGQLFTVAAGNEQAAAAAANGTPAEGQAKLTPAQIDAMGPLAEILFRRVTLARPETAEILDVMRIAFYNALGRKEQANEIQRGFLARINEHSSQTLLSEALDLLIAGDLDAGDRAQVRTLARALAVQTSRTHSVSLRQGAVNLAQSVLASTEGGASKLPPADLAATLADLMVLWYPANSPPVPGTPVPATLSAGQPRAWVANGALNLDESYLPPIRYLEADMNSAIEQVEGQLQQKTTGDDGPALGKALHDALARQSRELPAAQRFYPLMVSVYLDFCCGDAPAALATARALLDERPGDPDLRLLAAIILAHDDQPKEAVALLQAAGEIHDPEAARIVQYGILTFALAAEDKDAARAAALRLAAMRVPPEERDALVEKLRSLDLKDEADRLDHATSAVAAQAAARRRNGMPTHSSVLDYDTLEQLQALEKDKNTVGALALARNVLAALPAPAQTADQADGVADAALRTLDRLHQRDAFIAEARKQIAGDPDSLTLNYQLALLCGPSSEDAQRNLRTRHFDAKPPVWVRLTRSGGEIAGAFSPDGKRWTRIGHAIVPLGDAPEAVLAVTGWGDSTLNQDNMAADGMIVNGVVARTMQTGMDNPPPARAIGATLDSVNFTPTAGTSNDDGTVASWVTSTPPGADGEKPTLAADPARDGVFTLRGIDNGQDVPDWDALPTVHRPMGAAQEFIVRVTAFAGPAERARSTVGVMCRASLAPDAPFAALLVGQNGDVAFVTRQGPDPSLPYWRKLAQLRPKEARYTRLLATHLAQNGKWTEAAALYDSMFTRDPGEIISHYSEFSNFYKHDGARLAKLLLNWQPGPPNGRQGSPAGLYTDAARKCAAGGRDDLAVPLARRAVELNKAGGNLFDPDDHLLLLNALVRLGRRDEARDVLTTLFVPPSVPQVASGETAPRLGFESPQARALSASTYFYWFTNASWNGDVPTLPGVTALESVRPLGLLPDLEAALRARLAEPDGKQFVRSAPDWTLVFSRLCRHDPTILAELPARLNAKDWINEEMLNTFPAGAVALRVVVAELLLQWPGHEPLAMEALRYPESLRKKMNANGSTFPANYDLLVARVASQLGDEATATFIGRSVGERVLPPNARRKSAERIDASEVQACFSTLLRIDSPEADRAFDELYDRAVGYPDLAKDIEASYGVERTQRNGIDGRYAATAWLLDSGAGDGGDATLVYELRARHPGDKAGPKRTVESRGRSVAIPGGERTLTFFYGRDAKGMEAIGQTKTAAAFGTWRGPVPPGAGFLRVAADAPPGTAEVQGAPLRVLRTANLWTNPDFAGLTNRDPDAPEFSLPGWKDLPAGFWLPGTLNGPLPGTPYVQCELFPQTDRFLYGERVPVEADHAYLQSAWLRDAGDGSHTNLGRRYLDAEGKVLKTSQCNFVESSDWHRPVQRLDPKGADADGDRIPPGTAFIEPFVELNGAADWTGLFLGRVD